MMHRIGCMALLMAVMAGLVLTGCSNSRDSEELSLQEQAELGAGYYEVRDGNTVYVLGSLASADRAREGKYPARTIRRSSKGGLQLQFEANDQGLEHRLMHEYNRRHGLSQ